MGRDRAAPPEAKPLRLFVGIQIPEDARRAIAAAVNPLRAVFPRARWAPEENWHLTLKFLGATYPRSVDRVHERVGQVARASGSFETRLERLGSFPSDRRARLLFAGLDDRAGRMADLANALDVALAPEFRRETRVFTGHVTVARSDPPLRLDEEAPMPALEPVVITVTQVVLFRSHLQRPAPLYEPLAAFPLRD